MAFVPRDDKYIKGNEEPREELYYKVPPVEPHVEPLKPPKNTSANDDNLELIQPPKENQGVSKQPELIETVFEKLTTDSVTDSLIDIEKEAIQTPPLHFELKEPQSVPVSKNDLNDNLTTRKSTSNIKPATLSPIYRSYRRRTNTSSVFPVGCMGCKDEFSEDSSKTATNKDERNENVTEGNTASFISSSSKEVERNSLTGTDTRQETRRRLIKRKDGNPVLGIGYDVAKTANSNTSCKVPPGGFSHDLW